MNGSQGVLKSLAELESVLPNKSVSRGMPDPDDPHLREPVDRVARRVVGGGDHHYFANRSDEICSPVPLEIRPVPVYCGMPDLTGTKFGRLTVVGLATVVYSTGRWTSDPLDRARQKGGAKWLCRCECGMYTLRKTKAVRDPTRYAAVDAGWSEDKCLQCRKLDILKDTKLATAPCGICGHTESYMKHRKGLCYRKCGECEARTDDFNTPHEARRAWQRGEYAQVNPDRGGLR